MCHKETTDLQNCFFDQKRQHSFNSKQHLGGVTPGLPGPTTGSTAPNRQSRAGGWRRHWAGRLRDQGAGRSVTLASTCESWATCTQAPACAHLNHLTLTPLNEQVGLGGRRCAHRHVGDQRGQGQPVRSERFPALSRVRPRAPRTRGEARPGGSDVNAERRVLRQLRRAAGDGCGTRLPHAWERRTA